MNIWKVRNISPRLLLILNKDTEYKCLQHSFGSKLEYNKAYCSKYRIVDNWPDS